jgi:hypothetical protein
MLKVFEFLKLSGNFEFIQLGNLRARKIFITSKRSPKSLGVWEFSNLRDPTQFVFNSRYFEMIRCIGKETRGVRNEKERTITT